MNQRQFASVLFAVTGIFIAASRLPEFVIHMALMYRSASTGPSLSGSDSETLFTVAAFIGTIISVGIGVALLLLRDRLARRLFPASVMSLEAPGMQTVAFSVMGCYFAVQGLYRLGWGYRFDWGAAIQLVLGVALFFGARGLSRLWLMWNPREERHAVERTV
jgi:hypothetical protein